ncbi:MAG: TonB-dependent receptor [Prevotellaceae bacterium]|jgi:iron complex outermembrane receptor protein|nr:TonB-dependent receptor [Prevotellaceae bacterium]
MRKKIILPFFVLTALCANAQHLTGADAVRNEGGILSPADNINASTPQLDTLVQEIPADITLANSDLISYQSARNFDPVTVFGIRAAENSAVTYTDVSQSEIAKRNGGQDIPYLLALTPSFVATSDAGTGIGYTSFHIRGTSATRTNITTNGIPLNDAESHSPFFVNLPDLASSLSSVQVQRGVGSSSNGAAAFGASVNMETLRMNSQPFAEISGAYGSFNTHRYTIKAGTGKIADKFIAEARVSGINSDGYIDRAASDLKSYYAAAGYFGNANSLKFITFGGKEKTYLSWAGVDLDRVAGEPQKYSRTYNDAGEYVDDDGVTQFYKNQTDNYTQTHYQLHFHQDLLRENGYFLDFNAALHYTHGKGFYEEYKTARKYAEYQLTSPDGSTKTDLIRQKWLDNDFYGGIFSVNFQKNTLKMTLGGGANYYCGRHFGKILWVRNAADDFVAPKDWYKNNSDKTDANVFLKTSYEIAENLTLTADLQYRGILYKMRGRDDKFDSNTEAMRDITQQHRFNFFNPKFGASYNFDRKSSLYASFSEANREPTRDNYTDAGANERPKSERLFDTEIGYRFNSQHFTAEVNLYNMQYKNQLILTGKTSDIGEPLTSNVSDSYRRGVEISAGVKCNDIISWNGNLSLSRNRIKEFTELVESYDGDWNWLGYKEILHKNTAISYSPNVVANNVFTFDYQGFNLQFISSYVGRQYLDNTQSSDRSIDPYFVNNVAVNYFWKMQKIDGIGFRLLLNNLFNVEYCSNGYNYYTYFLAEERVNEKRYFPQAQANILFTTILKF